MEREDEDVLSSRNGGEAPDNKQIDDNKNDKKKLILEKDFTYPIIQQ